MTTCKLDPISAPGLYEPELPFSVSGGSLCPILAQHTTSYDVLKTVDHRPCIVHCEMFPSSRNPSPIYMPPQWSAFVHPEGKEYFYRDSGLPVVTEAYIYDPKTANKVCAWATEVERQAKNQGLVLNSNIELFLEIDENNCSYYLVDRATATLFWLREYTATELGLQSVVSDSHLKLLLEAQYWSHIENFCMHFGGLPRKEVIVRRETMIRKRKSKSMIQGKEITISGSKLTNVAGDYHEHNTTYVIQEAPAYRGYLETLKDRIKNLETIVTNLLISSPKEDNTKSDDSSRQMTML